MAKFKNTIDVLGDDAVIDSIIKRTIQEYNDDTVTKVRQNAFNRCKVLQSVDLPNVTKVETNAFLECTTLASANLPKAEYLQSSAFSKCSALVTVNAPLVTRVYGDVFRGCTSLTELCLPKATRLDSNSLRGCSALVSADFQELTRIDDYTFPGCSSLKALMLRGSTVVTLAGPNGFSCQGEISLIASGAGHIYVPAALIDSYKAANNWSTYTNQFRKLEEWTVDGTVTGELDIENRHMVRFFNSDGTLLSYVVVPTGGTAVYVGDTPVNPDDPTAAFKGFNPEPVNVTADMDCYAQYPRKLNDYTWAEISEISAAGEAANYFSVGDCKAVHLSGTMGTQALDETLYVYILGFNHNSDVEGTGIQFGGFKSDSGSSGVDVCLIDSKYGGNATDGTKYFNMEHWGQGNFGGWARCDMRYDILGSTDVAPMNYGKVAATGDVGYDATTACTTNPVANTLMSCLPADLRAVMRPLVKYSDNIGGATDVEGNVTAMVDYLPLMAEFEVFGNRKHANSYEQNYQMQYDYFKAGNSNLKRQHSAIDTTAYWWGRSPGCKYTNSFCFVYTNGTSYSIGAINSYGVAPVFLI